ncbi:unnamed protein product [Scytosiphon promiscuus]
MSSPGSGKAPWATKLAHEGKERGLPDEKIRQRLVLEGLEPELIDGILADHDGQTHGMTIQPSAPCSSPQRRQLSARKFHEMLGVGLSPAAVRQKMAMDGCQPDEINSFFAAQGGVEPKTDEQESHGA